jgi:hypothetical protein
MVFLFRSISVPARRSLHGPSAVGELNGSLSVSGSGLEATGLERIDEVGKKIKADQDMDVEIWQICNSKAWKLIDGRHYLKCFKTEM